MRWAPHSLTHIARQTHTHNPGTHTNRPRRVDGDDETPYKPRQGLDPAGAACRLQYVTDGQVLPSAPHLSLCLSLSLSVLFTYLILSLHRFALGGNTGRRCPVVATLCPAHGVAGDHRLRARLERAAAGVPGLQHCGHRRRAAAQVCAVRGAGRPRRNEAAAWQQRARHWAGGDVPKDEPVRLRRAPAQAAHRPLLLPRPQAALHPRRGC
jgi:hypothetical protein